MDGIKQFIEDGEISIAAMIDGQKNTERDKEIRLALLNVEQDHIKYFESKSGKYPYDKHDRLHNHWQTGTEYGIATFKLEDNCLLPEHIKTDAIEAVKRIISLNK